jgi:hypothetical protein
MQTNTVITHNFQNPQDFVSNVAKELFDNHLRPYLQKLHSPTPEMRFHSKKETAKILGIAMSNLSEKTKNGEIEGSRFGGRVLYSDDNIKSALQKIRTV